MLPYTDDCIADNPLAQPVPVTCLHPVDVMMPIRTEIPKSDSTKHILKPEERAIFLLFEPFFRRPLSFVSIREGYETRSRARPP